MTVPEEKATANYVPAAAVIRRLSLIHILSVETTGELVTGKAIASILINNNTS